MRITRQRVTRLTLAAALLAAAAPAGAQIGVPAAQPRTMEARFGIGYVANLPNQFAGVSAHVLTDFLGGFGVYVDAKFDLDSPEDEEGYVDSLTARQVDDLIGDPVFHREASWRSVNVALLKAVSPQFTLYLGAGTADRKEYRQYLDDQGMMGRHGHYWVRDEEASGAEVNVLGGAFFQLTRAFAFQMGFDSNPRGVTLGASYLVPIRR